MANSNNYQVWKTTRKLLKKSLGFSDIPGTFSQGVTNHKGNISQTMVTLESSYVSKINEMCHFWKIFSESSHIHVQMNQSMKPFFIPTLGTLACFPVLVSLISEISKQSMSWKWKNMTMIPI